LCSWQKGDTTKVQPTPDAAEAQEEHGPHFQRTHLRIAMAHTRGPHRRPTSRTGRAQQGTSHQARHTRHVTRHAGTLGAHTRMSLGRKALDTLSPWMMPRTVRPNRMLGSSRCRDHSRHQPSPRRSGVPRGIGDACMYVCMRVACACAWERVRGRKGRLRGGVGWGECPGSVPGERMLLVELRLGHVRQHVHLQLGTGG
jgi:hypothetical protein